MAKLVLTNAYIVLASTDISSHVTSVSLSSSYDIVETTKFGDTAKTRVAGLADNQVSFEFHQDFATGSIESLIYPLLGTAVNCELRPVNTTVGATNPKYSFSVLISEWTPLSGAVGELATATVQWPISGVITKATS